MCVYENVYMSVFEKKKKKELWVYRTIFSFKSHRYCREKTIVLSIRI